MHHVMNLLRYFSLSIFLIITYNVFSIPAYPGLVKYTCPDGTQLYIRLRGDENFKWAVTEENYILLRDSIGDWCYAQIDNEGLLYASKWKLSANLTTEDKSFIRNDSEIVIHKKQETNVKTILDNRRNVISSPFPNGKYKTLVILMQYKDLYFQKTKNEYYDLFNKVGYNEDGAKGSVKDFYLENSYGKFDLTCDVIGPFTAKNNMEYYGGNNSKGNDIHPEELFLEALSLVSGEVDFADYDTDGDGILNNVHIIFAGYGEEAGATSDAIWSHEVRFYEPIDIDGFKLNGYSCAPEFRGNSGKGISRIGVHCHEIGHSLGAMDFYDTDYNVDGEYLGTGVWDLMAAGSWNEDGISPAHFNPYVKKTFGWVECETLTEGDTLIPSSFESNKIYCIKTEAEGDYFLLENRQQEGFSSSLPGSGLMIYHILPQITELSSENKINTAFPQACYPVCAGSDYKIPEKNPTSYGNINSEMCPFPGKSFSLHFDQESVPAALAANGTKAKVYLRNIVQEENGDISFTVVSSETTLDDGNLIFSDSFEEGNSLWNFETIKGNVGWEIYKTSSLSNIPNAYDGNYYLAMINSFNSGNNSISRSLTNTIKNENISRMTLSFVYQNMTFFSSPTTFNILYKSDSEPEWIKLTTITEKTNGWQHCNIDLPYSNSKFQIAFEGELETGYILIDNVKIYASKATSTESFKHRYSNLIYKCIKGGINVRSDKHVRLDIYDLSGILVFTGKINIGENYITLRPGIYIGISEGISSKFYVR